MTRIPLIRRAIISERGAVHCLFIVVAALLAATAIRIALSVFSPGVTFSTYYPAILICTLLAGWRYGFACAVLSGIIAELVYPSTGPVLRTAFDLPVVDVLIFLVSSAVIVATADALRRTLRALDDASQTARILNQELQHRVGNMLAVVQALAAQSAKGALPERFAADFGGRLQALATAHELLGKSSLGTCTLLELIEQACRPFCDGDNIVKTGPNCQLPNASCVPLVLTLHELCTNAVKYGALSIPQGRVEISWSLSEAPDRVIIEWQEIGGPPVSKPVRRGLGSALLRRQPGIAAAKVSFEQAGLRCWLTIDGAEALAPSPSRREQT